MCVKKTNYLPFWRAISHLNLPETQWGYQLTARVSSKDSIIDRNTRIQSTGSLLLVTVFIALSDKPTRRVETVTWLLATRDKQFTFRLVLTSTTISSCNVRWRVQHGHVRVSTFSSHVIQVSVSFGCKLLLWQLDRI